MSTLINFEMGASMMPRSDEPSSRRAQNMEAKRQRIFNAATELFDQHGFAAVTTQQVSDRADIAAGTLFRYVASKSELLLMTYNKVLRDSIDEGARRALTVGDTATVVYTMVAPIVENAGKHPENTSVYQRELLFGSPGEEFRRVGLTLIAGLEQTIAQHLLATAPGLDPNAARQASAAVFAVLHMAIARMSTQAHPDHDAVADLTAQIRHIVSGALSTAPVRPT